MTLNHRQIKLIFDPPPYPGQSPRPISGAAQVLLRAIAHDGSTAQNGRW
ncbi:MAG: hypothetical protein MH252_20390 [Thermosynechococcaceae cyanobacterium MS004]|nr:hypothetical protein [Thermosynechococcaceae cyanobacterium MS004]